MPLMALSSGVKDCIKESSSLTKRKRRKPLRVEITYSVPVRRVTAEEYM